MSNPIEQSAGQFHPTSTTQASNQMPPPPPVQQPIVVHVQPLQSGMALPAGVTSASPWARLGSYFLEGALMVCTFIIGWLIWAAMTAGTGQTPAKRLMKLRVIDATNMQPVGFGRMFWLRGLVAGFVAFFGIGLSVGVLSLMPFWDRRNQNIWDKVSSTYVVSDPNDAWVMKPDLR